MMPSMNKPARPIPALLAERKSLAEKLISITERLNELDSEIMAGFDAAREAAIGLFGLSASAQETRHAVERTKFQPQMPPADLTGKDQGSIGEILQAHVVRLLQESGRPMKIKEIFLALQDRGVKIPGKDPQNNLSAHLSRSGSIARRSDGWWFAEKQTPPEGGA